ncbi:MAG: nucleotidyltransferase family protein [Deltaproteobacteria bacterium]|nr:nucleotidyltransferase family protein [Deltaproteobacteria bacterium]
MWGIIPAAGAGSRIQPLAFSKELLPVGSSFKGGEVRPRAVSEYLVERMIVAGADRICFVIAPGKSDILEYYGAQVWTANICYAVQPRPLGLCDAIFRALPMIHPDQDVCIGLPDTIWFPQDGLRWLPANMLAFLLFPVEHPEYFDSVIVNEDGTVREICVKAKTPRTNWVWGAFRMPGRILHDLYNLWQEPGRNDIYVGTLVNAWLARGGAAMGVRAGTHYVDVGTLNGYREAIRVMTAHETKAG